MTAITTRTEPCWTLDTASKSPAGGEHYDTRDLALTAAAEHIKYGDGIPAVTRLPHCCSTATLACGYRYNEDDRWVEHWESADALRAHLLKTGHRPGPDDTIRCPAGYGCIDCDALPDVPDYSPLPGQLDLFAPEEIR